LISIRSLQIVQESVCVIRSSAMIILEVKARHAGHAAKALPSGSSREQGSKNGMKRRYQYAFGVRELVGRILAQRCSCCEFLRVRLTGSQLGAERQS